MAASRSHRTVVSEREPRLVLRFALYTGAVLLAAGLATLWIVNREVANRAIFLSDGVILEEGTPEQLFNNPQQARTQAFLKAIL